MGRRKLLAMGLRCQGAPAWSSPPVLDWPRGRGCKRAAYRCLWGTLPAVAGLAKSQVDSPPQRQDRQAHAKTPVLLGVSWQLLIVSGFVSDVLPLIASHSYYFFIRSVC